MLYPVWCHSNYFPCPVFSAALYIGLISAIIVVLIQAKSNLIDINIKKCVFLILIPIDRNSMRIYTRTSSVAG